VNDGQRDGALRLALGLAFLGLGLVAVYGWQPGSIFLLFLSVMFILVARTPDGDDDK
jgi:hypothetical protein